MQLCESNLYGKIATKSKVAREQIRLTIQQVTKAIKDCGKGLTTSELRMRNYLEVQTLWESSNLR